MKGIVSCVLVLLFVSAVAVALRVPHLNTRPMHADEAVQAARFRDLWQTGRFTYDPNEFHGPTLIYATLPSATLSGAESFADTTEATYRVVPVFFGIALVVLILTFSDILGRTSSAAAALLAAASPAMVFYSRYYIHEMLLAFFTLAAIACGWRYARSRKLRWCLLAGACIGLMQATKETAVLAYLAAGFASIVTWLGARGKQSASDTQQVPWSWWHLAGGVLVAIFVAVLLLSSFFTNLRGPLDGVLTYLPWLDRAGGASPHINPWSFYLHRLVWWRVGRGGVWSEGFIVALAVIGLVSAWRFPAQFSGKTPTNFVRWLAGYTLAMTVIYSLIPYKTPWCLLQFLVGMILLAGVGVSILLQRARTTGVRAIIAALLIAGGGHLAWQAYQASFVLPANVGNPYVFAQTSPDVLRLADTVQQLAETSPQRWATPVKVIWGDAYYWPLPWYLRRFEHVELWRAFPTDPAAPVVISSPKFDKQLTAQLDEDYLMTDYYELRPQVFAQLWVRFDLWEAYLRRLGRIE